MALQIADQTVLDEMLRSASESPRRRAHKNFHESLDKSTCHFGFSFEKP